MNSESQAKSNSAVQTVYGSLMHHRAQLQAMGEAAQLPPYNAAPKAPVLYIKPANTHLAFGQTLHLPASHQQLAARACVGLIYKPNRPLAGIKPAQSAIKNIVTENWHTALLCDFSLPHSSFYRPPLRFNALDGSLALPRIWTAWPDADLRQEVIETWVNGVCVHSYQSADWMCPAMEQLQGVSEFIAWEAGDVLMLGCPPDTPFVNAEDVVETRMKGQIFTRTLLAREAA